MNKVIFIMGLLLAVACSSPNQTKIPIIVDTDANNELDDQHALAYLFFNADIFDIKGVTTNATFSGGAIEGHHAEAQRVMQLCNVAQKYPLLMGADQNFETIAPQINTEPFDGQEAVDFIIEQALSNKNGKLVLAPIGKLTNIALAIKKAPEIKDKIRIVWLGSNYPAAGEYNLDNDRAAVNYLLDQAVDFEMVMVRYGEPSGSDAVRATPQDIISKLQGKGPEVAPVKGRHGGTFRNFGDYAVNLFSKIDLPGDPPSRALYDLVALAILKNPEWGMKKTIPAPQLVDGKWQERPNNNRSILIWENFDAPSILADFYQSVDQAQ